MTLFRHKNGKLYILEMVKRRMYTEIAQLVAIPFRHNEDIKKPKIEDFAAIADANYYAGVA
jgi:hypothetical protein